ncbi:acetylglutamate kinase [Arenimonas maotaiensis]|uniref:Acetylglutamate kinase n=1 Tax=Arenimonas maotaiensis TaxID=1446479 RepID=A0A917CSU1_9GAMM|nr:acetylglutamate kinase [Arenimonas maotaiensis]GGF96573.1 acetylglutamate kinase [Arenimonas maotaiensis]
MSADSQVRDTIVRLLSNIGSAKEIQQYLKRFSQRDASRFAVVKVGGAILRDDLDALVSSLGFLQQVGLTPIVLHGAGPQLDAELAAQGVRKRTVDGLRVTTGKVLKTVRRVCLQENLRLVEALQVQGIRAVSLNSGVLEAKLLDAKRYGMVGKVVTVHTEAIYSAIKSGSIPVISSLGETADGQIVNINADWAANEVVKTLKPYKIIFLTGTGGLLDGEGRIIDSINLSTDYAQLIRQPWLHSGMKVKIEQIAALLEDLPKESSVSITKPSELAKELFTHRGSGTLVRKGQRIQSAKGWSRIDKVKLQKLLESGFGKKMRAGYFRDNSPAKVYYSADYRAALVLLDAPGGRYLDKFAVADDAQGEGLGAAAWSVMRQETPKLFWRSRHDNPINAFYLQAADGCLKCGHWTVFWYGLEGFAEIERAVAYCLDKPASFHEAEGA